MHLQTLYSPGRQGYPWLQVSIMAAIRHPNVVLFMGVCLEPPCMVTEWCSRGSLYDVLQKVRNTARNTPGLAAQLDWARRLSIALDAAKVCLLKSFGPCCCILYSGGGV